MLAFRSGAHLDTWLSATGRERGAVVAIGDMPALGSAWFGRYLDADFRPRPMIESQAILARLGLTGRFWELA